MRLSWNKETNKERNGGETSYDILVNAILSASFELTTPKSRYFLANDIWITLYSVSPSDLLWSMKYEHMSRVTEILHQITVLQKLEYHILLACLDIT